MSIDPPQNPNPGYQNPNPGYQNYGYQAPPPKRSGPGCWLWVPLGCLAILIIFVILCGVGVNSAFKSIGGKELIFKAFGGVMQNSMNLAQAEKDMQTINAAVNRYHTATGMYPANLQSLVPTYIPSAGTLHSALDPNTNPNHVSYTYQQPANNSQVNTPYLSITDNYTMNIGPQTQQMTIVVHMSLNGAVTQQQSQTVTTSPISTGNPTYAPGSSGNPMPH